MANDNQTALMMSIQRKKDRLKQLMDSGNSGNINYSGRIRELEFQITEDEKLLAVDRANHIYAHYTGQLHGVRKIPRKGDAADWYNEKYGTDGK